LKNFCQKNIFRIQKLCQIEAKYKKCRVGKLSFGSETNDKKMDENQKIPYLSHPWGANFTPGLWKGWQELTTCTKTTSTVLRQSDQIGRYFTCRVIAVYFGHFLESTTVATFCGATFFHGKSVVGIDFHETWFG
jgi:hypothetical protein